MKRWFSLALILALLSSTAFAENAEPAAEAADSALAAAGLVIEESETPQVDAGSPEDVLITDDGQTEVFSVRYGRVTADSAAVYADESAQEAFAAVPAGSVVLLVASAGQGRVQAAFFTGEAIVQSVKSKGIIADFIMLDEGISRINVKIKSDEETEINPPPERVAEEMRKRIVYLMTDGAMILSEPDDTHLTVFNADPPLTRLIKELAAGEGLFVWQPVFPEAAAEQQVIK